jgi:hypothetical protein
VRPPGHLLNRLVGELDQPLVEEDRLDVPDPLELDLDALLLCEPPATSLRILEQCGQLLGVEMALVEELLGRFDDGRDDSGVADDVS